MKVVIKDDDCGQSLYHAITLGLHELQKAVFLVVDEYIMYLTIYTPTSGLGFPCHQP